VLPRELERATRQKTECIIVHPDIRLYTLLQGHSQSSPMISTVPRYKADPSIQRRPISASVARVYWKSERPGLRKATIPNITPEQESELWTMTAQATRSKGQAGTVNNTRVLQNLSRWPGTCDNVKLLLPSLPLKGYQ